MIQHSPDEASTGSLNPSWNRSRDLGGTVEKCRPFISGQLLQRLLTDYVVAITALWCIASPSIDETMLRAERAERNICEHSEMLAA